MHVLLCDIMCRSLALASIGYVAGLPNPHAQCHFSDAADERPDPCVLLRRLDKPFMPAADQEPVSLRLQALCSAAQRHWQKRSVHGYENLSAEKAMQDICLVGPWLLWVPSGRYRHPQYFDLWFLHERMQHRSHAVAARHTHIASH